MSFKGRNPLWIMIHGPDRIGSIVPFRSDPVCKVHSIYVVYSQKQHEVREKRKTRKKIKEKQMEGDEFFFPLESSLFSIFCQLILKRSISTALFFLTQDFTTIFEARVFVCLEAFDWFKKRSGPRIKKKVEIF